MQRSGTLKYAIFFDLRGKNYLGNSDLGRLLHELPLLQFGTSCNILLTKMANRCRAVKSNHSGKPLGLRMEFWVIT